MKRQRNTFLTPLIGEVLDGGRRFKLYHKFTYIWTYKGQKIKITVPRHFETDFASIPRLVRIIISKLGLWTKPSVIHDYLYQWHRMKFTRKMADQCFRDGMRDRGVPAWQFNIMYLAVRLGGWMAWKTR